ncbi:MAG: radical SAM protein [Candidatus Methanoperedens sp.]|nr:radical SAM protein [Candidatus Methanoperedens sp.]MCE8427842.1 radical SAM protein [Candidatus Methanoperedens sp.]
MPSDKLVEMPFLRNIGFVMTYRCQIACPHCIIKAGPDRREEILLGEAFDWIEQIVGYRRGFIKMLSLTGGEPFYNIKKLKKISTFGESHGLIISAVTNAFWASSPEKAVKILRELPSIKLLAISTDVYHQESIPFAQVKNAVLAARKCGIPFNIHVCTENAESKEYLNILKELQEIAEKDTIITVTTFPVGRAMEKMSIFKYKKSKEPPISACSSGSTPIVFPDGRVIACIGPVIDLHSPHPLVLGNLRKKSLHQILDNAELNPILHAIRIWGPKKLISMLKDAGFNQYLPESYIKDSVCNACYNLMSNTKIVEFLALLANDSEFKRKIAYARVYYLKETEMTELYQLAAGN